MHDVGRKGKRPWVILYNNYVVHNKYICVLQLDDY